MASATRERNLRAVKKWALENPNYRREWAANNKIVRAEDRAAEIERKRLHPPVVNGKITYSITVENPLSAGERVQPTLKEDTTNEPQRKTKKRRKKIPRPAPRQRYRYRPKAEPFA